MITFIFLLSIRFFNSICMSPNFCIRCISIQRNGDTALTFASKNGHIAIVKALVDAGADLLLGPVSTLTFVFLRKPT